MPDNLTAAQGRARFAAGWLAAHAGDTPPMVRQFLYEDVPALFSALHAATVHGDHRWTPEERLAEEIRASQRVAELVRLVRLSDDASDNDLLWRARESDIVEAIRVLCLHRLRVLVEQLARELSATTWRGEPVTGPVGPVALEWRDD